MKTKAIGIFIVCFVITYFICGYFFVKRGWLSNDFYTLSVAIISGAASIITILTMFTPLRTKLNEVQPSLLNDISKNLQVLSEQKNMIEDANIKLTEKEKQLLQLDIKRKELEVFIKKTSLVIFLNDQAERNSNRLKEIIERNREVIDCIEERKKIEIRLKQLNEEIVSDENYDFFNNILNKDDFLENNEPLIFSNIIIRKMYSLFDDEYLQN